MLSHGGVMMQTEYVGQLDAIQNKISHLHLVEAYQLIQELEPTMAGAQWGELLLMRAELKLFLADASFGQDLEQAAELLPQPAVKDIWQDFCPRDPNAFFLFGQEPGSLDNFCLALDQSYNKLVAYAGERTGMMARQLQSEILYYQGKLTQALKISEYLQQELNAREEYPQGTMAGYTQLRCLLALGRSEEAQEVIRQIVSWVRVSKDESCASMYDTIRSWINLTTGWSGDTPRYHATPDGMQYPVLEDRMAAIDQGIADLGVTERPFAQLAVEVRPSTVVMRQLFMDVFDAVAQFRRGKRKEAAEAFLRGYQVAYPNQLAMPLVEYGAQIVPLLEHVMQTPGEINCHWLEELLVLARGYEQALDRFRE